MRRPRKTRSAQVSDGARSDETVVSPAAGSASTEGTRPSAMRRCSGPTLVASAALVAVLATLSPGQLGPGVTCDEPYHAALGKQLVTRLRQQGIAFFTPANIRENFRWPEDGPPVQAPLGHWILGFTHYLLDPAPDNPQLVSIAIARFAPALSFGLLVLLVGLWTLRRQGRLAGTVAAAAVVLVPRVFGHAHLAALDMLTALFFVGAVLAVTEAARGGRWWQFALAGVVWGLAMLVRLHGLLIVPPVAAWLIWQRRRTATGPLLAWGTAGMATLYAGWPWLWLSPVGNLLRYVASGAGRQSVNVYYFGRIFTDRDAPWHYPWVMFTLAVPVGLLAIGVLGVWAKRRRLKDEPELALAGGALLFVLLVFSLPGVPVYDGVRLFLMAFPLWAIWVGIGASWLVMHPGVPRLGYRARVTLTGVFLLLQGFGLVVYHPCQLSHYNLLAGGLWGAERLGFEVCYWGDAVNERLLGEAVDRSEGGQVLFGPNLAPFQAVGVAMSSPALLRLLQWRCQQAESIEQGRQFPLVGWDASDLDAATRCGYAVIYQRRANPEAIRWVHANGRVVETYSRQGVWLAELVELRRNTPRRAVPED